MRSLFAALGGLTLALFLATQAMAASAMRDLPYGPSAQQRLDVYLPPNPDQSPVIVMVHGGGWRFGDKANDNVWRNKVAHWTTKGAILVSVNYRLLPDAGPLDQAKDVARALAFVQKNAANWGGAGNRLVLMGHSAGGHLAALLSADPIIAHMQGVTPWMGTVVLDTAALDIPKLLDLSASRLYHDAFGSDPDYWRSTSPLHRLAPGSPPMLLVCSTQRILPCPEAERFQKAAKARGNRVDILPVDYSHRSINAALGMDRKYTENVDAFLSALGLFSADRPE